MIKYDLVKTENNIWHKKDDYDYFSELKKNDQVALRFIHQEYINYSSYDLIKYTYTKYPYYAINSTIAERILNQEELVKVNNQRRRKEDIILYTIGYEGISLESYLNKLIIYDVRVLCDVRKNSSSMKYGFNKSQLKNACNGVGIKYVHIPEVGIESDKRQELSCQADYDMLFDDYKRTVLIEQKIKQLEILTLLKKEKRIALTCFEANICQCHRKHLAESISKLDQFNYDLIHLK